MQTNDFHFELPSKLIARKPTYPRDRSKLMVIERKTRQIFHSSFHQLSEWITPRDLLILNNSKVIPARLFAEKGKIELLLLEETSPNHWLAIGKPARKLLPGNKYRLEKRGTDLKGPEFEILRTLEDGSRVMRFYQKPDLKTFGELPLPPYIQKAREASDEDTFQNEDFSDYQTTYAQKEGSVAAPTAGLHFTSELLNQFNHQFITLHVGLGTFRPVKAKEIKNHQMHRERYWVPESLSEEVKLAERVIAVGTTSARVLESNPKLNSGPGDTNIFIHPPYSFKRVDSLITNFHLPGSTLIMLIAAFMGHDLQKKAYQEAIDKKYRFYSYGDAMLIL
ncbi:MAG: tRNA preQ1(34) S-adenosylmethionine ribosyltransferase-isomerase QueA [Verrucomicrobiota bacterium]